MTNRMTATVKDPNTLDRGSIPPPLSPPPCATSARDPVHNDVNDEAKNKVAHSRKLGDALSIFHISDDYFYQWSVLI